MDKIKIIKIIVYILGATIMYSEVKNYYGKLTTREKLRSFIICLVSWVIIFLISLTLTIIDKIMRMSEKEKGED